VDAKQGYVSNLLDRYRQLPSTLGHILHDDRKTARALRDRHISLEVVQQAFILATARRLFGSIQPLQPIRTLRYFLPVIEEILKAPLDPDYLQYLRWRLRKAGGHAA